MVLASQSSGNNGRRKYMSTSRRRPWRRRLIVLVVALFAFVGYRLIWGGDNTTTPPPTGDTSDTAVVEVQPIPLEDEATAHQPTAGTTSTEAGTTDPRERRAVANPGTNQTSDATPPATAAVGPRATAGRTAVGPTPTTSLPRAARFREAATLIEEGRPVEGRRRLSSLLTDPRASLSAAESQMIRDLLAQLNQDLVFSKRIVANDTLTTTHQVAQGQYLSTIARPHKTPWRLLERVNGIKANRLRAGSTIKVIRGPFHAVVHKAAYRMDVCRDETTEHGAPGDGQRIYIRSFDVGHGADNATPAGLWLVESGRKLIDPPWTNPRTGEFFAADDPKNPIGDRWIGLKGVDPNTRGLSGYGIHGTIEPDSIGKMRSMGCIRLLDDDVAMVYDLLQEGASTVEIRP